MFYYIVQPQKCVSVYHDKDVTPKLNMAVMRLCTDRAVGWCLTLCKNCWQISSQNAESLPIWRCRVGQLAHYLWKGHSNYAKLLLWMRKRKTSKVLLKQSLEKEHQRDWNNEGLLSEWDHESLKPCGKAGRWTHAAADHSSRTSHQDAIQSWQGC